MTNLEHAHPGIAVDRFGPRLHPSVASNALTLWVGDLEQPGGEEEGSVELRAPGVGRNAPSGSGWVVSFRVDAITTFDCDASSCLAPGNVRWLMAVRHLGARPARARLRDRDRRDLAVHVATLGEELSDRAPGYVLAARSRLVLLLVDANRILELDRTPLPSPVAEVLAAIEQGFRGPLSLDALAESAGMDRIELRRE